MVEAMEELESPDRMRQQIPEAVGEEAVMAMAGLEAQV
jgi:hypothetical protein